MKSAAAIVAALSLLLAACAAPVPPPRYYLLRALPTPPREAPGPARRVVMLPVRLPDYLDRPEMVLPTGPAGLRFDEGEHWADHLPANIGRVVAEDLQALRPADLVLARDLPQTDPAAVLVLLDIADLLAEDGRGEALLRGRWSLLAADGTLRASRPFLLLQPAGGADRARQVTALDEALLRLAGEIAEGLRQLPPGG